MNIALLVLLANPATLIDITYMMRARDKNISEWLEIPSRIVLDFSLGVMAMLVSFWISDLITGAAPHLTINGSVNLILSDAYGLVYVVISILVSVLMGNMVYQARMKWLTNNSKRNRSEKKKHASIYKTVWLQTTHSRMFPSLH